MNKILLCTKHMLVYIHVECNSCRIRTNWNTRTAIYIYNHICAQYLKVVFASSEMILTVVMDERTYLTYEKGYSEVKVSRVLGMTSHQCGEWGMFVSKKR